MSTPARTSKRKRTPTKRYQQEEDCAPVLTRQSAKRQRAKTNKQTAKKCNAHICKEKLTRRQIIRIPNPNLCKRQKTTKKERSPPHPKEQDVMDMFSISEDSSLSSDEDEIVEENRHVMFEQMLLPHLASYLVDNPDQPPENYFLKHYHRLSQQDLLFPIGNIHHITSVPLLEIPSEVIVHEKGLGEGVYITDNELEAIQGLSRFSSFDGQE